MQFINWKGQPYEVDERDLTPAGAFIGWKWGNPQKASTCGDQGQSSGWLYRITAVEAGQLTDTFTASRRRLDAAPLSPFEQIVSGRDYYEVKKLAQRLATQDFRTL